jgi:hypothetical protein
MIVSAFSFAAITPATMPAKKNSSEGEYSSAISRFLPDSEDRDLNPSRDSTKANKRDSEIVLNDDNKNKRLSDRDVSSSRDQKETHGDRDASGRQAPSDSEADERTKVRLTAPYVDEAVSHVFEESWLKLRRMTGEKVSQSEVIEAALAIACDEFTRKEEDSALYRAIESIRAQM